MAKIRGVNWEVYNATDKIPNVTNVDLDVTATEIDASDHDSGAWGETMTGTWRWKATVAAFSNDGNAIQKALRDAGLAGTTLTIEFRPNGTGTTKTKFTGSARVLNFKMGGPQDGVQPFNFDLGGVGALTEGAQS